MNPEGGSKSWIVFGALGIALIWALRLGLFQRLKSRRRGQSSFDSSEAEFCKPVVDEALAPDVGPKIADATGLDALYAPDAPSHSQPPAEGVNRPEEPVREKETSPLSSSSVPRKPPQSSEDKSKDRPGDSLPTGQDVDDTGSNDKHRPPAEDDLTPDAPLVVRCEIQGSTTVSVFLNGVTLPEGLSRMPDQIQLVVRLYDVVLSAPVRQMPPGDDQRVPHEFCCAPIDRRQGIGSTPLEA